MSTDAKPIEAEVIPPNPQAIVRRTESGQVSRPLTVDEIHQRLEFVRQVMRQEMKEGQDYGKIPGCGDKPTLLQPGAQKLLMTFNLCAVVRKEECRDYPGGHREYAFTVCIKRGDGAEWDGVGTCSTLESKYRYRKAERKCPKCGHATIAAENPKFLTPGQVAGWFCWKKKGGCGAKFAKADPAITSQGDGARTENPDPADTWNTVRKMAFKRALVAGSINATNTSELWTQDIEDGASAAADDPGEPELAQPVSDPTPPPSEPATAAQAKAPAPPVPTVESRTKMIRRLLAGPGQSNRQQVTEYFRKLVDPTPLAPFEEIEEINLRFVPATEGQFKDLANAIDMFGAGHPAAYAFPPHPEPKPLAKAVEKAIQAAEKPKDPLWWRNVIISLPRKGMKRDAYLAHPDTIGALYDKRHGNDEESNTARQRLWGLQNWKPEPREFNGKTYQPTESDWATYRALQAFFAYFAANHPDEKL